MALENFDAKTRVAEEELQVPDYTWSCQDGNDRYSGETRVVSAPSVVFDTWIAENGERKHTRYTAATSVTDASYENGSASESLMVRGRARTGDGDFYAFSAQLGGEETEFSYIEKRNSSILKAHNKDGTSRVILQGTAEYEQVMVQMRAVNFDPPCRKP